MRVVMIFLAAVSTIGLSIAHAEECRHRIVYLPQWHGPDEESGIQLDADDTQKVAASQLKIAQYIERFPSRPVFSEGNGSADLTSERLTTEQRQSAFRAADSVFPGRLPDKTSELNERQTKFLVRNGADGLQFMRGTVSRIHAVLESQEAAKRIFDPIIDWLKKNPAPGTPYPREIARLVYREREEQALKQITKYFAENPSQREAILIYGANHNFQFYPELFPPQCVIVPAEFKDDWDGRMRPGPEEQLPSSTMANEASHVLEERPSPSTTTRGAAR